MSGVSIPYRNYPGVDLDRARSYYEERKRHASGFQVGAAFLQRLDWDTSLLGFECGRVDFAEAQDSSSAQALASSIEEMARAEGIQHISARFDARDGHLIQGFCECGFEEVDEIVTFTIRPCLIDVETDARLATNEDIEAVQEIARAAFTVDRFHNDPHVPRDRADSLHAMWAENSVMGKAADAVVVAEFGGKVVGFVTCKIQATTKEGLGMRIGTIVLVATSSEARGKGVAKTMVRFALDWFSRHECDIVEVGTQRANDAACRLYEGLGFRETASFVSLRLWLP